MSMVIMWGSLVAAVRHTVLAFPSMVLKAEDVKLSAVTVQPLAGSGAAWVTATGTADGMMCAACEPAAEEAADETAEEAS
ncbi:hypothetical protein [Paractinoplanes globisporus]|uniref:Secreted protein n=1 Tax=Paractinoplanes globisporus TaxID=113565 RepID=A0ABW6WJ39_9ACTN